MFPLFLGMFLLIFFFTGIGNGSTYKMIPAIFRTEAERATGQFGPGTPERDAALLAGTKKASAAVGIIGAVGAIGGFLIPITFGSPWVTDPLAATRTAFLVFGAFYIVCASVTYGSTSARRTRRRPTPATPESASRSRDGRQSDTPRPTRCREAVRTS